MAGSADNNKTCDTTDCTGDCHCTDNNLFHLDTGISGSILALTYYCDLIALLTVFQINKHSHCQNQDNDYIPAIFLSEQFRKPSAFCSLIDDTDCIGTFRIFPEYNTISYYLHGNIIQHQSKQCLICIPVCFKYSRDHSPDHSAKCTCHKHYDQE